MVATQWRFVAFGTHAAPVYSNGPIHDFNHGHLGRTHRIARLPIHSLRTHTHLDLCVAKLCMELPRASHVAAISYPWQAKTSHKLQLSCA